MPSSRQEEPDIDALRSAIDESRIVLDHQIDLVAKIDDIAMHTLRTSVVVIGILVSVAGLAGPTGIAQQSTVSITLLALGIACLIATVVFGIATLSTSSLSFGISESHRHRLVNDELEHREWASLLLEEYSRWQREMELTGEKNSRWLYYVLGTFGTGIVLLTMGTGVMMIQVVG